MRSEFSLTVGSGGRRMAAVRALLFGTLAVAVLVAAGVLAGCGSSSPPIEVTLGKFGAAVGTSRQDQVNFAQFKADWATSDYGNGEQSQQALFALFMAAKAADQALNQPKVDWITYSKGKKDDTTTVTFKITPKDGNIFSAVSVSQITVQLKKTDDSAHPWRIQAVTLGA